MSGLLGIHITPPESDVEPPTHACFSMMRGLRPASCMVSAAHMAPPPLPMTTKSKLSFQFIDSSTLKSLEVPLRNPRECRAEISTGRGHRDRGAPRKVYLQ